MRQSFLISFCVLIFAAVMLAACGDSGSAPQVVEDYLEALVAGDADRLVTLSCAEWEADARLEADSFGAVSPTLEGGTCEVSGTEGDYTLVACTGSISATYNGEQRQFPLDEQIYRVVFEGGEWRMCGYQEGE